MQSMVSLDHNVQWYGFSHNPIALQAIWDRGQGYRLPHQEILCMKQARMGLIPTFVLSHDSLAWICRTI